MDILHMSRSLDEDDYDDDDDDDDLVVRQYMRVISIKTVYRPSSFGSRH